MLWVLIRIVLISTRRGTSNEYPQHMFPSRYKKNIDTFDWKTRFTKSYAFSNHFLNTSSGGELDLFKIIP